MKYEEIGKIYQTYDYDAFMKLENNRIVTETRKKKLIASISNGDVLCPIIVNKKMEIIDGQARYEARKQMSLPIVFIVDPEATINDCMRMNSYNTRWTTMDFVRSWASSGNENYIRLLDTINETGLSFSTVIRLSSVGSKGTTLINDGTFVYSEDRKNKAIENATYAKKLSSELALTKRVNESFYSAVTVMKNTDGFNEAKMLNKAAKNRSSFQMMAGLEDMLKEFSRIYNKGSRGCERKLYFEDYMRNKGSNVRDYSLMGVSLESIDDLDISTLGKGNK